MGANLVNTAAEALAERVARPAGGRSGCILTNLCDRRCVRWRPDPDRALATAGLDGGGGTEGSWPPRASPRTIPIAPPPTTRGS
jgi:hypothetical protein